MSFDETQLTENAQETETVEVTEKKNVKKKKRKAARYGSDKKTTALLVAILGVGICLLCVSVVGMVGVSADLNKQQSAVETTTAGTNVNQTPIIPVTTTVPSVNVDVQMDNPAGETTTAADAGNENQASSAPSSDSEWLAFFNTAVNKLKTDAPAMTKAKQTKTADIQLSNPLGQTVVSSAKDKYLSDEVVETPIAKGDKAAAQANVSPDGASYVSNLTMSDIKSVSGSVDASGNYVIKIAMNDMSNPELSSAYGKIFEFMTVDDVMEKYAPDMGATVDRSNVELKFKNCSATATVTPDGKVVSYQTTVNANMILKNAKISVITTDLDATLFSETKYTNIAW